MLLLFIKHCCCTAKGTNGNCERLDSMWTYRKPTKNHWATQCIGKRGRKYIQVSIWSRVIKCSSVRWRSSNQLNMLQTEATQNTRTLYQQPVGTHNSSVIAQTNHNTYIHGSVVKSVSDEVMVTLSVRSKVQTVYKWSSWCHCNQKPHHLLPHINPDCFTFPVLAYPGCPGEEVVKQV